MIRICLILFYNHVMLIGIKNQNEIREKVKNIMGLSELLFIMQWSSIYAKSLAKTSNLNILSVESWKTT